MTGQEDTCQFVYMCEPWYAAPFQGKYFCPNDLEGFCNMQNGICEHFWYHSLKEENKKIKTLLFTFSLSYNLPICPAPRRTSGEKSLNFPLHLSFFSSCVKSSTLRKRTPSWRIDCFLDSDKSGINFSGHK